MTCIDFALAKPVNVVVLANVFIAADVVVVSVVVAAIDNCRQPIQLDAKTAIINVT